MQLNHGVIDPPNSPGQRPAVESASQTCTGPFRTGVDGTVTVTWTASGLSAGGVWALTCG